MLSLLALARATRGCFLAGARDAPRHAAPRGALFGGGGGGGGGVDLDPRGCACGWCVGVALREVRWIGGADLEGA